MSSSYDKFSRELSKSVKNMTQTHVLLVQKKLALEALRRIVMKTPVDTGRARGNWQVTINAPARGEIKGDEDPIPAGTKTIEQTPVFAVVYITNNVPYIIYLEKGRSKQAPKGMVELTINELRAAFK